MSTPLPFRVAHVMLLLVQTACVVLSQERRLPRGTSEFRHREEAAATFIAKSSRAMGLLDEIVTGLDRAAGVARAGVSPFATARDLLAEVGAGEAGAGPERGSTVVFESRNATKVTDGRARYVVRALVRDNQHVEGMTLTRTGVGSGGVRDFRLLGSFPHEEGAFAPLTRDLSMGEIEALVQDLATYREDMALTEVAGEMKVTFSQARLEISGRDVTVRGPNATLRLARLNVVADPAGRDIQAIYVTGSIDSVPVKGDFVVDSSLGDPATALARAFLDNFLSREAVP